MTLKHCNFTAIISDLHLCEEEPINFDTPLWKKFKTREFFFDKTFADFIHEIEKKSISHARDLKIDASLELILNGDIFDFDSVTSIPHDPSFHVNWLEKIRGLGPREEKSVYKIDKILQDHPEWVLALRAFIVRGNHVVFIAGNHDVEILFPQVQEKIREALDLPIDLQKNLRFCEWFYISGNDTLVEHGHMYDPYCCLKDPISPMVRKQNSVEMRLPFGNLACRYLINGMGFFNPHSDNNYIMSLKEYVVFFLKYIVRKQPLLMWDWFWGSTVTLIQSVSDHLLPNWRDPLKIDQKVEDIAAKSNCDARVVRQLRAIGASPAASQPLLLMRELWLDRAFFILLGLIFILSVFSWIYIASGISFFWVFIPVVLCIPFFMFYSNSIQSKVHTYKEPQATFLDLSCQITGVNRIVYGHTHHPRHEIIGFCEHLNSGTWSPNFSDVECTKRNSKYNYVWIEPLAEGSRHARLLEFTEKGSRLAK